MLFSFMSLQLVMALVLPDQERDLRWILAAAVLLAVIWALMARSWLRISATELRAGRGPFTHKRLARAEVVVVREDDRSLNRRARSVKDLAWLLTGRRLIIERDTGYVLVVAVSDVVEALDDLRAAGFPASSTSQLD